MQLRGFFKHQSNPWLFILLAAVILSACQSGNSNSDPANQSITQNISSASSVPQQENDWWKSEAEKMVEKQIKSRGIDDDSLLRVMKNTPRHRFVPEPYQQYAYSDQPLPIGHDQTISQPYIVALMTSHLDLQREDKVLEIGTGSAYQAAILSALAKEVYTIEIVEALAKSAATLLEEMEYDNVHVRHGNGYKGWPEQAPFDKIIVTAAPGKIPQELLRQLKAPGKMILPVGDNVQYLKSVSKKQDGSIRKKTLTGVRFVPMIQPEEGMPDTDFK
ncbi:MAG: protein-L-isoaspartate(D-aspartate) O-methyltransferase [Bacteroidales bacterium]